MMKRALAIMLNGMLLFAVLSACRIQQDPEVNAEFRDTYSQQDTLDAFCGENNDYMMKIEIEDTRIQLVLREDGDKWSGDLSLYDGSGLLESIPAAVEGDELVIYTGMEKRVPMSVLLFTQFDPESCTITASTSDVMGMPSLEEVIGLYPPDELKAYMQTLYDEVLSNLTQFDRKEDYMAAISELDSFAFNRYTADEDGNHYSLTLGFSGNENVKWDPGFGGFENVSMLVSERTPIAW